MLHRHSSHESERRDRSESRPEPPSTTHEGRLSYWQLTHDRLQHFEIPWREEPDHFERLLTTLHCVSQYTLGVPGSGLWVEVYRNKKATPQINFQYLVTLNTPADSDTILVDDLPDLLTMLEHLAPIIRLSIESARQSSGAGTRALEAFGGSGEQDAAQ